MVALTRTKYILLTVVVAYLNHNDDKVVDESNKAITYNFPRYNEWPTMQLYIRNII